MNIEVSSNINSLLIADTIAESKAALGVLGAAVWNFVGAYSAGTSYAVGDVVTYQGQTWYRLNANGGNVGDTPAQGTFWTLVAKAGVDGGGNVVGPSTSVANRVSTFSNATGNAIQSSPVSISTAGAITTPQLTASVIPFYYANFAAFPASSAANHGAIAHDANTGAMYYSHGGTWVKMLDTNTTVITANLTGNASSATTATTATTVADGAVGLGTAKVTGLLPVTKGGTGVAAFTSGSVLVGAGALTPTFVVPSTAGNVLTSNGSTWQSLPKSETLFKIAGVSSTVTAPSIASLRIGSIPLSAADAVAGKSFNLDAELLLDGTGGGSPFAGNDKLYLVARFGLGTPVFTSGCWFDITPLNIVEYQKFLLPLLIQASLSSPYNISPVFATTTTIRRSSAPDATTPASVLLASPTTFNNPLLFNTTAGVATTLEFYLVSKADDGTFSLYSMDGSIVISSGAYVTGELA